MALDHLEEAEQGNVGVNLNDPAEGGPDEQLNVGRHYKSDKDMSSTSMIEEHMSLGLSEQPAGMGTDHIYGDAINEGSQSCDEKVPRSRKPGPDNTSGEGASSTTVKPTRLLAVNGGLVLESSLRPVIGRKSHILKQQKINLLDIDAALPEEALRASKSQKIRCSWRAFVKDAESISQKDWWYWSSFTAAMKTSTVSSLALRIYTLDDCIIYTKDQAQNVEPADNTRAVYRGGRRRKEPELLVS
ncbi:hypothetical protein GUJ93_ZPchr0002g23620 [Zizania palustris]|uniref:Uncharacterized protein n=1 Tax=Zizania palustris TaxID=103762 RepID=A0A8J5VAY5_ZIZPA|nr:hypothetical protein GUJ93_ZPchr0002g23620 [Zizania palustris]